MDRRRISIMLVFGVLLLVSMKLMAVSYSDSNDKLNLPFQTTTLNNGAFPSDARWYTIRVSGGKVWEASDKEVVCSIPSAEMTDANYFCFVGDNTDGFHIYNRLLGPEYVLCCASSTSHEPLVPVLKSSASEPSTLKISKNTDGYNFYYPGNTIACVNDLHGDGVLTLWTSQAAPSAVGCRMYVSEVDLDMLEPVQEEGVPFRCTRIKDGKFATNTHWYTIDIRSGKLLQASSDQVLCNAEPISKNHLWCFTGSKAEGFTAYNYAFGTRYTAQVASFDNESILTMEASNSVSTKGSSIFFLSQNSCGGYNFYFPGKPNVCWNDFGARGYVALWNSENAPYDNGSNMLFTEYDPKDLPQEPAVDSTAWMPLTGEVTYIYMKDGSIEAFPNEYVISQSTSGGKISVLAKNGSKYTYESDKVDSVSKYAPADIPQIVSYKFNNKFNDMLMQDAQGVFTDSSHISIEVGSIGKRLVASVKTSCEDALVYIGDSLQKSKCSSRRFHSPVTYTVSMPGWRMLRRDMDGVYGMHPFGNEYQVNVTYLSDKPTTEFGVPVVKITTDDGTMITSKARYWSAKISIDGAGFLPDMPETAMSIKGRGNSSWLGSGGKNPYRIKFESKQKPLGMKAGKNWNLIANSQRESMTTNIIGSRVAEMVGCAAANHFLPVELYINGSYQGSYTLTEKVGFSNNSIDLQDESNAVLLELDTYYDEKFKFKTTRYGLPVNVKYPEFGTDETNLSLSVVSKHFNQVTNAIQRMQPIDDLVDPVYLARFLMVNDLIFNQELSHPKSTFLYNENLLSDTARYIFGPVWDCDWGFGYQSQGNYFYTDAETDYYNSPTAPSSGKAFLKALRYNAGEELNKQYYRVWTDFVQNHLSELLEYLDDYYRVAAQSFEHDNTLWYSGGSDVYSRVTQRSKQWLQKRADFVFDYLANTLGYAKKGYLDPDVPDGVDIVVQEREKQTNIKGIFDLYGRKVGDDLQSLPSGIYIQNGIKIFKK